MKSLNLFDSRPKFEYDHRSKINPFVLSKNNSTCAGKDTLNLIGFRATNPRKELKIGSMQLILKRGILVIAFTVQCSCTTGNRVETFHSEPPPPESVQVDPAAYESEWFTFRKPMKSRPKSDIDFYFKHCTLTRPQGHYSKTDYFCEYP